MMARTARGERPAESSVSQQKSPAVIIGEAVRPATARSEKKSRAGSTADTADESIIRMGLGALNRELVASLLRGRVHVELDRIE